MELPPDGNKGHAVVGASLWLVGAEDWMRIEGRCFPGMDADGNWNFRYSTFGRKEGQLAGADLNGT